MKGKKSLEGMSIEPEERIDLSSEDAVERLDGIHAEIEARRPFDPERVSDASEEVTAEDERELEEAIAFHDEVRKEYGEVRGPDTWLARERDMVARELRTIAKEGGFSQEEVAGIARRFAARLAADYEALQEGRRKDGQPSGKAVTEEDVYLGLMRAYEAGMGPEEDGAPRETRRIEPLAKGAEDPPEDDATSERAA